MVVIDRGDLRALLLGEAADSAVPRRMEMQDNKGSLQIHVFISRCVTGDERWDHDAHQ